MSRVRPGRPDHLLLALVLAITGIGLLAVYSASFAVGWNDFGNPNYFILRQALSAAIGLGLLAFFAWLPYPLLRRYSPLIMLLSLVTLFVVLLPHVGVRSNGANRWIALGPLPPLEPSEFAKLAMVIYIAAWLAAKGEHLKQVTLGVVPFVMMVGLVGGLILAEPDMGTTIVITLTTMAMFFIAGAALRHVFTLVASGVAGGVLLVLLEGYRSQRWEAFLDAEKYPSGAGYHILQLLIALGSGGLRGVGLGASRQKLFYVPGAHTDGIFAIIGEEAGFIGAVLVLLLFAALIYRGFRAGFKAPDEFSRLLAIGITCWIGFQTIINIGGITRSIPMTGIPLPFLSYGGSALMATLAACGVLLNVSRHAVEAPAPQPPREPVIVVRGQPASTPLPQPMFRRGRTRRRRRSLERGRA
ncbi:MAG TPA: putative lipid II flippase FtsW [Dehalococcoidia bacterium]|nr:putative lipid II flippase FtsW [Dehalococcoidia bacterium]